MIRRMFVGYMSVLLVTAACNARKDNVWDMYDVRHPSPSGVVYQDNDAVYTPPYQVPTPYQGYCTQGDLENLGCR